MNRSALLQENVASECYIAGELLMMKKKTVLLEKQEELMNKAAGLFSSSVDCYVDNDRESLAILRKDLESVQPQDFKETEAEGIALKLITFRLVDTINLAIGQKKSETQKQQEILLTMLNQTQPAETVCLIKRISEDAESSVTAIKLASDQWNVYETDISGKVLTRNHVSTDDLLADGFVLGNQRSRQDTLDPREMKRQQSAQNRRRKQDEIRRTALARDLAQKERNVMLRKEFMQLVDIIQKQKHYSFEDFLEMEKRLTDPFLTEVMVENIPYNVVANNKETGAFNSMVINTIQDKFFAPKRKTADDSVQNRQSKKAKTQHGDSLGRRQVPTNLAEDAITATKKLDTFDCKDEIKTLKSEHQKLQNERKTLQRICDEIAKSMKSQPQTYWNVSDSDKTSHIIPLYCLFDGPAYSTKKPEEMRCYLKNPKIMVTKETTDHKIACIHHRRSEIDCRVKEISALLESSNE
jgi:hypothetical protein